MARTNRLGLLKRRRLGLTVPALVPVVRQLTDEGRLTGDAVVDAVILAEILITESQAEYQAVAGRDWQAFFEALIAFLEQIIPLILRLIDLFT